jgi:Common central domain of tyrosinase/Polyphenol oxidase middle domain
MVTASTTQIYVRRNIWSLEAATMWDPVSLAYARAVRAMQQRHPDDPTSWSYQTSLHSTYTQSPQPDWNMCQHANWFFLPWHRLYIYWFEQIVRAAVIEQGGPADWALPYWDYSSGYPGNSLPPAFRATTLPDTSPNPLYVPDGHRAPGINQGAQLPSSTTSYAQAFNATNFASPPRPGFGGGGEGPIHFGHWTGALENQPHNVIHDLVGGQTGAACSEGWMSDPNCAAQDPIFWLHHSNIDRLWVKWILQPSRNDPSVPTWLNQSFTFYKPDRTQVRMTVADILDVEKQLSYRYDDMPPVVARPVHPEGAALVTVGGHRPARLAGSSANSPVSLAATRTPIDLAKQPTSVAIALSDAAKAIINPLGSLAAPPPRISLNVEDIRVSRHPGHVYAIYLNLPDTKQVSKSLARPIERDSGEKTRRTYGHVLSGEPDPNSAHFVGHVTFFGATHVHGGGGLSHSYDITNVVRELKAQGQWDERRAMVTFVPVGLIPPPGASTTPASKAGSAAGPALAVQIGRVSITSNS